jgi:hypothetical protein
MRRIQNSVATPITPLVRNELTDPGNRCIDPSVLS